MNFEKNCDVLKPKSSCILLSKKIKFNKTRWNRKWKILHIVLERWTLCFCSCKNCKLKKSVMRLTHEKKEGFFHRLFFPKEIFFDNYFLFQFIVYWIQFQSIHTFTYQKTLFHALLYLILKASKAFSVSLSTISKNRHY